mmetsp:Transcript_15044/g.52308  ORF Transcript_15044/g.52308 Transcript_15044/m.52308 type:complete len:270 (+) Transcript_15044:843-1652(+)
MACTARPCVMSHSSVLLSLPDVTSRLESCGHQLIERMPAPCCTSSASGVCVLARRSHRRRHGRASSSEAVTRNRPSSGFHAMSEKRWRAGSRSCVHGLHVRRSHTATVPLAAAVPRMCFTSVFHATAVISLSSGVPHCRGGMRAAVGRSSEKMPTSWLAEPDANMCRAPGCGLNSRAVTGALWASMRATSGDSTSAAPSPPAPPAPLPEASTRLASHKLTTPSVMPPAMRPSACLPLWLPTSPQAMDAKRVLLACAARVQRTESGRRSQ